MDPRARFSSFPRSSSMLIRLPSLPRAVGHGTGFVGVACGPDGNGVTAPAG
eukprot:m.151171 g.151171  ORF g.151171 m.151171 type:complete len:51 (-) comp9755_c0_seq3:491-643(-)